MLLANRNKDMHAKYHFKQSALAKNSHQKCMMTLMSLCALAATHQLIGGGRSILACMDKLALWSLCSATIRTYTSSSFVSSCMSCVIV